jgi:HK97 family phage major capsid protein
MDAITASTLKLNDAAQHERAARLLALEAGRELAEAERKRAASGGRFSIVRAITAAATGGLTDGYEAEVAQELARRAGSYHDTHRPWIPWSALSSRTLLVGTATLGGNLVAGDQVGPAVAALFPVSTVVRLGAQVLDGQVGDVNYPRFGTNASGYWLTETGTATASAPVMAQIQCSPKTVGAYTEVSRQLLKQSAAERVVGNHLLGVVGAALDAALLAGTSTDSTVPLGIRYTSGVAVGTGTSFSNDTAQLMVKNASAANLVDENIRFLGAPAVRELLAKRASNGTGSPYLWHDDKLASKPAAVNANAPASTLFCGDFSTVLVPTWGEGLRVEVNPYAQFQSGIVALRVFLSADIAVTTPAGFDVRVGIT